MINCTVLNITQIIVILILLTVLLIQNCGKKRRNKLLKGIDMTILEISIPGCESFCFYIHPDRETAAKCEIGCEYPLNTYSYYVSQGFGYRQIEEQKIKEKKYASEQERMEKNFYVSLILPKDGPGYVEHWITCKRRANNMIMRGQINGTVYSIKNGLKKLREHNRKFKGEESSANSNIE